jgi:hypothetical protein
MNVPHIPKVHFRWNMEAAERVESFTELAELLTRWVEESGDRDDAVAHIALSLAAAYVEGAQDSRLHAERGET